MGAVDVASAAASLTALATALMRAVHSRDPSPLIEDTWAEVLVRDDERDAIRMLALSALDADARAALESSFGDAPLPEALRRHPVYGMIILRSRYAEDALAATVEDGARQYVIVGAGMDSFALRRPAWATSLEIFEVDLPETQALKRRRLAEAGIDEPSRCTYVAADLAAEEIDAVLARNGFRAQVPSFFSWLGVTSYLTREANVRTLDGIAQSMAPGSQIVFTYIDQAVFDRPQPMDDMQRTRRALGGGSEPWVSGFDPTELPGILDTIGFELLDDASGVQLGERYGGADAGLIAPQEMRIARARRA